MLYHRPEYLGLLLSAVLLFMSFRSHRARQAILLLASGVFYAWADWIDTWIFLAVVASVFLIYLAMKQGGRALRRIALPAGISLLVLHLFGWKYAAPWIERAQDLIPGLLGGHLVRIAVPLGLSYYTIQGISFLVDARRGRCKPTGFLDFFLFKAFFPQLLAGPIVRGEELLPQTRDLSLLRPERELLAGFARFALGFCQKTLVADRVAPFVDEIFLSPASFTRGAVLLGCLGFLAQIDADFSGYSNMAIGSARMFGIILPENFLSPMYSRTPSEVWFRWHTTFSRWIRDYLYRPLALTLPKWHPSVLILLTLSIAGLWHGPSVKFVVWGLYCGLLLVLERGLAFSPIGRAWRSAGAPGLRLAVVGGLTFLSSLLSMTLFRSATLRQFEAVVGAVVSPLSTAVPAQGWETAVFAFSCQMVLGLIFYRDLRQGNSLWDRVKPKHPIGPWAAAALGAGLAGAVALGAALRPVRADQAFIYFSF